MIYEKIRKKYQGKCYLGYEMNGSKTYLFIKKVHWDEEELFEDCFITYSDVIYLSDRCILFKQNSTWAFGTRYIENYQYKEIPKSRFISVINKLGFKRLEKNNKKYHIDMVRVEDKQKVYKSIYN